MSTPQSKKCWRRHLGRHLVVEALATRENFGKISSIAAFLPVHHQEQLNCVANTFNYNFCYENPRMFSRMDVHVGGDSGVR